MRMATDIEVAHEIAQAVGRQAMKMQADAGPLDIENKEDIKRLKDSGDAAAQVLIDKMLDELRPEDARLSEERPDDLGRLDADRVWITDPIDGTSNYGYRGTEFAVHIALWERGKGLTAAALGVPAQDRVLLSEPAQAFDLPQRGLEDPVRVVNSRSHPSGFANDLDLLRDYFREKGVTNVGVEVGPCSSAGIKTLRVIDGDADVYVSDGGFNEWDAAAPCALALSRGLTVTHHDGSLIEFNRENPIVESFVVARPELHPYIVEFLSQ